MIETVGARKILHFNIQGGYRTIEEYWQNKQEDENGNTFEEKPLKMIMAYSDDGDWIGEPELAKRFYKTYGINHFEKISSDDCVCSLGYSPKHNKWYGWSHRGIFGFTIGNKVKKGDCAYALANREEWIQHLCKEHEGEYFIYKIDEENKKIHANYTIICNDGKVIPMKEDYPLDIEYGHGEWTAKTMEDAKQMAIDFAKSVS